MKTLWYNFNSIVIISMFSLFLVQPF